MVRRADAGDLDALVEMRCAMWDELNPKDPSDAPFEAKVRAYYAGALVDPMVVSWIAEDAGAAVGMVTLLLHQHPPRKHDDELRAYVTAMFVARPARRRGHARALIEAVIAYAKDRAMRRVILRCTEEARALYRSVGFAPLEHLAIDFR
jgi:GNAT superfamily N-acetyltransferase